MGATKKRTDTTTLEIEVGQIEVRAMESRREGWNRRQKSRSTIFVFGEESPEGEEPAFGTRRGDNPEVDRACDAWNRQVIRNKRAVAEAALRAFGFDPSALRLRWSKHAGCSTCPCSPGFRFERVAPFGCTLEFVVTVKGRRSE